MAQISSHTLRTRQLLIHTAGTVVTALLIASTWEAMTMLQTTQANLQDELQAVATLVRKGPDIRAKHEQLAATLQSHRKADANRQNDAAMAPNDAQLLAELSKLANSAHLAIKTYSPGQSSTNGMQAQISATASYAGICQYLDGLSSTRFPCQVTQCSIAAPPQDSGECTLEMTIRAVNPAQPHLTLAADGGTR